MSITDNLTDLKQGKFLLNIYNEDYPNFTGKEICSIDNKLYIKGYKEVIDGLYEICVPYETTHKWTTEPIDWPAETAKLTLDRIKINNTGLVTQVKYQLGENSEIFISNFPTDIDVEYGETVKVNILQTIPNHRGNWIEGNTLYNSEEYIFTMPEKSVTLVANASPEGSDVYTVAFDLGGCTEESTPATLLVEAGDAITLPNGTNYNYSNTETRFFLGWKQQNDNMLYSHNRDFIMPSHSVTLTAAWSADYFALDNMIDTVEGYQQAGILPANSTHDPLYVAGGDFAALLESDGTYPWGDFDTTALETALAAGKSNNNRNLPQSEQATVDALTSALQTALNNLTLLDVDYDLTYKCTHNKQGYYDSYTHKYYPTCESGVKHSYNSVVARIDVLLDASETDSLYTADSIQQLRTAVYGSAGSTGIVQEVQETALKKPAQILLEPYVDQLAEVYHTIPVLKGADYTPITYLMTGYLLETKYVTTENMQNYYTQQSSQALMQYYYGIDATYKITRQSFLNEGGRIYNELKQYIDALVVRPADYRSVYEQILHIPRGGTSSYPSGSPDDTEIWLEWTNANAGHISQAVDAEFLNNTYAPNTVANLNEVLDGIDWTLNIFDQDLIDGMQNNILKENTIVKRLSRVIAGLVRRTYSVMFMLNDGTAVMYTISRGYYYSDAVQLPISDPVRDNYVFLGWSTSESEYVPVTSSTTVTGDMTIYATWGLASQS